ncbi:type II and III secretion system protein family protein [Chlorobaculum sp. 24CR]|uniref:type II and III secretion system protein family protein n=1 Tax=Chlorobaculum sp. 24CR TaxID=2508878 RepID=UPI001FD704EE|nr:pilus assembly protein N-terminal domain-containing protein [Chlorobaculum sp. 24CR]
MSALVALLAGVLPAASVAAPEPVVKQDKPVSAKRWVSPAPVAKKSLPEPVAKKSASKPFAKKELPAPARRWVSPATGTAAMDAPSIYRVPLGESRVYRFRQPIRRVAVGDPKVADYIMMNRSEIYLLGKKLGSTNLVVWGQNGNVTSTPIQVSRGTTALQAFLKVLFPKENDIQIFSWGQALVLSGSVSDALVADSVTRLVTAYLGGSVPGDNPESALIGSDPAALKGILGENNNISTPILSVNTSMSSSSGGANSASAGADSARGMVNLLKIRDPQQVRLEVCIAQVSRTFLESLGVSFRKASSDLQGGSLLTGFVSNATLNNVLFGRLGVANGIKVVADRKPSLFKVLAEPTIVTMSGKEGYFLVGGKVYLPSTSSLGRIEYIERTYGVGLRFTPVVLDAGRISLKVVPEFSEPDKEPLIPGATNMPSFKVSTVSTSVQMNEGENLVIGGLMLDNFTNVIDEVPLLGEIPIIGALFRDTQKNGQKTELMVIVRPTLVKASTTMPELPTDKFVAPTSEELFFNGKLHGSQKK